MENSRVKLFVFLIKICQRQEKPIEQRTQMLCEIKMNLFNIYTAEIYDARLSRIMGVILVQVPSIIIFVKGHYKRVYHHQYITNKHAILFCS